MGKHANLISWLRERIKFDRMDLRFNKRFADPDHPNTRAENAGFMKRIAEARRLLKRCKEDDAKRP